MKPTKEQAAKWKALTAKVLEHDYTGEVADMLVNRIDTIKEDRIKRGKEIQALFPEKFKED